MRASAFLVLIALSSAVSAAELGTLFHTAKEREQLERLRKGEKLPDGQPAIERPDPVITGYVKRSDGKSTVFIDKQPVPVRNPRLEKRLEPKAVERYEPLPPPVIPVDDEAGLATKSVASQEKPGDSKSATPPPPSAKPPAPRKRVEKDD
ncbi:MAG: hypothetical protein IPJ28_04175 [Betaproteobacteria bacterium]|nr:hypothetical protein [Betaproteobacteria bacterium]